MLVFNIYLKIQNQSQRLTVNYITKSQQQCFRDRRLNRNALIVTVVLTCAIVVSASAVLVLYDPFAGVFASEQSSRVFDADLTYVSTGLTNATGEGHDHFGWGIPTYPASYYPVTAILTLTYRGNPENQSYDIIAEGYMVNLTANTGAKVSVMGWLGTNYNVSCHSPPIPPLNSPWGHFSSMYCRFNMSTTDEYYLRATNGGTFSSINGTLGLWSNGAPNTVTVTVQRVGWLIVQGNQSEYVINPAANEIIQQIQLEKMGDEFGFGTYPAGKVY